MKLTTEGKINIVMKKPFTLFAHLKFIYYNITLDAIQLSFILQYNCYPVSENNNKYYRMKLNSVVESRAESETVINPTLNTKYFIMEDSEGDFFIRDGDGCYEPLEVFAFNRDGDYLTKLDGLLSTQFKTMHFVETDSLESAKLAFEIA